MAIKEESVEAQAELLRHKEILKVRPRNNLLLLSPLDTSYDTSSTSSSGDALGDDTFLFKSFPFVFRHSGAVLGGSCCDPVLGGVVLSTHVSFRPIAHSLKSINQSP